MSGHTKWTELRDELRAKTGAEDLIARAQEESAEELRRHDDRDRAAGPGESEVSGA